MKNNHSFLILPLFLVFITTTVESEEFAREKVLFEKWANKLYFAFGKRADTNRDKTLSVKELRDFSATELVPGDSSKNDMALRIFNRKNPKADTNRDRVLTRTEFLAYLDLIMASDPDF